MKVSFLGELPFDPKVVEGGDRGVPVLEESESSPFAEAIREFTETVLAGLGETGKLEASNE